MGGRKTWCLFVRFFDTGKRLETGRKTFFPFTLREGMMLEGIVRTNKKSKQTQKGCKWRQVGICVWVPPSIWRSLGGHLVSKRDDRTSENPNGESRIFGKRRE